MLLKVARLRARGGAGGYEYGNKYGPPESSLLSAAAALMSALSSTENWLALLVQLNDVAAAGAVRHFLPQSYTSTHLLTLRYCLFSAISAITLATFDHCWLATTAYPYGDHIPIPSAAHAHRQPILPRSFVPLKS